MEAPGGLRKPFWRGMPPPTPQKRVGGCPFYKVAEFHSERVHPGAPATMARAGARARGAALAGALAALAVVARTRGQAGQSFGAQTDWDTPPTVRSRSRSPTPPSSSSSSSSSSRRRLRPSRTPTQAHPGRKLAAPPGPGAPQGPAAERSGARCAPPHRASARPPRPARVTPPGLRGRRPAQGQWAGSSWGSPAPRAGSWWRTAARRSRAPRDPGRRPGRGVTAPGGPRRGASPTRTVGGAGAGLPCSLAPALSTPPSPAALPPASPAPREERETDRRAARRR